MAHSPFFWWGNLSFLGEAGSPHCAIPALELVNAPCGVDKLLLSGEERVACGTNADLDVFAGGPCAICRTTGTKDDGLAVVGMNIRLHS